MKNVFLSFLGIGQYSACNYILNGKRIVGTRYVQEAILKVLYERFGVEDELVFALTAGAREKNWNDHENNGHVGLKKVIDLLGLKASVRTVDLIEVKNEAALWTMFTSLYEALPEKSRIYLDVTHAFRYMPMLGFVLLNYSRLLKDIEVAGIYYGALETLGSATDIEKLKVEDRDVPVFDVTALDTLNQWGIAAEGFVRSGVVDGIETLVNRANRPFLKEVLGNDEQARELDRMVKKLNEFADSISYVRQQDITSGRPVAGVRDSISKIERMLSVSSARIPALIPVMERIKLKMPAFENDSIRNNFLTVKWCIEHRLIQQGITLLCETLIEYAMDHIESDRGIDLGRDRRRARQFVSGCLSSIGSGMTYKWDSDDERKLFDAVNEQAPTGKPLIKKIADILDPLKNYRNSINHAGYDDARPPANAIKKALDRAFERTVELLKECGPFK